MKTSDKIFVAGHRGMVGGAIHRNLILKGYKNIITRTRIQLPLDDQGAVDEFFSEEEVDYVFLAAAKVGGIYANTTYPADFIYENLSIQKNVINASHHYGVKKLLFLGSSCIYPKYAAQPIIEDSLLTGPLEETNIAYASAKIAGKIMCDAYAKQHGSQFFTVMPSNIYGIGDNFHPENSHLVAGMMRRIHEAKLENKRFVSVWGTGKPLRELTFADDLGAACVFLMEKYSEGGMINVGSNQEISVQDLANELKEIIGFQGRIEFDESKPDGAPRKLMNSDKLLKCGYNKFTPLNEGLRSMYQWYLSTLKESK